MKKYIHQLKNWPNFEWDHSTILTSSKWAKMTKCSQDTALRDIQALVELGVLVKNSEGGRSTSYILCG